MAGINSFPAGSGFTISSPDFKSNREKVSKSQIPAGLRSSVQDRIKIDPDSGDSNFILLEQLRYLTQENTGRLIIGDTDTAIDTAVLSPFRSIQQKNYLEQEDPSSRYLEVAFSPQNQINDDIVNQIGFFNIGDYIGDVRQVQNNNNKYPDLDALRDQYFTKFTKSYDLVDFTRLIKFFDNSLFRMIKDFTPSNVTLTSGVVIKQHILERNRHKATSVTTKIDSRLSGSINVESFSGGTGGSLERFQTSPTQFYLTQSWDEVVKTVFGPQTIVHTDEAEFYNGEYGYPITVKASGPDCQRFTNPTFEEVEYKPVFVTTTDFSEEEFLKVTTVPNKGIVWLWWEGNQVKHIKVSNTSQNDTDITNLINKETTFSIFLNKPSTQTAPPYTDFLPSGVYIWEISDRKVYNIYTYLQNNPAKSPYVVYSEDIDTIDFNLEARGDFIWEADNPTLSLSITNPVISTGITSSLPQGYFPVTDTYPKEQFFRGWDNAKYLIDYEVYKTSDALLYDPSSNLNEGQIEISTANETNYEAIYGPSTEPWFMNSSASYREQTAFTDLSPSPRPPKQLAAIQLAPLASCDNIDINTPEGIILGIDYDKHSDLFTLNGSSDLVLKQEINGSLITEDLILYTPNYTSIVWNINSLTTAGGANTNIPLGGYGVYKLSTTSNDSIIITIGLVNGRPGVKSISYCPTP